MLRKILFLAAAASLLSFCCLADAAVALSFTAPNEAVICPDPQALAAALGEDPKTISVTELPDAAAGRLFCRGVELELLDALSPEDLEWLAFEPFAPETSARLTLQADTDRTVSVALISSDEQSVSHIDVSARMLEWRQADRRYWEGLFAEQVSGGKS